MKLGHKAQEFKYYRIVYEKAFVPSTEINKTSAITPGLFVTMHDDNMGWFLYPKEVNFETILDLPGMPTQQIIDSLDKFWAPETKQKYDEMGLFYKRGVLLHGEPGTGKTVTVIKVCEKFISKGGIVIFNPTADALNDLLPKIRDIEPNLKVMIVWEEFDEWKDDSQLLSLLDGELSTDNIVYLATTNFIDKIPARIKNRPSRFAEKIEVKFPTLEDRKIYLSTKMPTLSITQINVIAESTEGLVIDQIKDIVISTEVFNLTMEDAIKKVKTYNIFEEEDSEEDDSLWNKIEELKNKMYPKPLIQHSYSTRRR